jgi:hypothetical protein
MQDVRQLLKQKEEAINQVRQEVEALRFLSPWFTVSPNVERNWLCIDNSTEIAAALKTAMRTAAPLLMDDADEFDPEIRARLIKGAATEFDERGMKKISSQLKRIASVLIDRHPASS